MQTPRADKDCRTCGGTGKVPVRDQRKTVKAWATCPKCRGSGKTGYWTKG